MGRMRDEVVTRSAPYYSLVVYDGDNLKQEGHPGIIADIRKHDPFLPQMIVGQGLSMGLIGKCDRSGVQYFGETMPEIQGEFGKIFYPGRSLANLTVVKIGGSAFDFVRQTGRGDTLETVCTVLTEIHQTREQEVDGKVKKGAFVTKTERLPIQRLIVTAGAGQHGDVEKDLLKAHADHEGMKKRYPLAIAEALQQNLNYLKALFGGAAKLLTTETFYHISRNLTRKQIPLIGTSPHYLLARDRIPLQDSDTHTIALAEFYGARRVVLIKRTDGIYDFDPYRGFILDQVNSQCADSDTWATAQLYNRCNDVCTVSDLLSRKVTREGSSVYTGSADGTSGHLMEDSALQYFSNCRYVEEILVMHIAPDEMYALDKGTLKHIVTGGQLSVQSQGVETWQQAVRKTGLILLEKNLRAAILKGEAQSRIMRN